MTRHVFSYCTVLISLNNKVISLQELLHNKLCTPNKCTDIQRTCNKYKARCEIQSIIM